MILNMNKLALIYFILLLSFVSKASNIWQITATDTSNYNHCFLGNGIVGIRTDRLGLKTKEIYINGLYDCLPGGYPTLTNYYRPLDISLSVKNEGEVVWGKNVKNWKQTINLKEAILYTTYNYGEKLKIKCTTSALRNNPMSALNSIEVEALQDVELTFGNRINLPERDQVVNKYKTLMGFKKYQSIPVMYSLLPNLSGEGCIAGANAYYFSSGIPDLAYSNPTPNSQLISFNIKLNKGQKYTFSIVGSFTHTGFTTDPFNDALRFCAKDYHLGVEVILSQHKIRWEDLWKNDIEIEGDDLAQRDVRMALYSLYSSIKEGMGLSIPPCGLSSDSWGAHIFWDAELWMYPALLVMNPGFAHSMLDFRYNTKKQCRKRAIQNGFEGIMFPWESDMEGNETCTVDYKIDMNEHHITADVGIAFWNYYLVTRDKKWLQEKGYPILKDIANFWVSRSVKGSDGKYHILNVIGPDEYHEDIDDNAFTNGAAKHCLQSALNAAELLNETPNPKWREVANSLVILTAAEGHTLQYKTYKGETIKQADVNLLSYPLNIVNDPIQVSKDLEYYQNKIDANGPAMGQCVLATIYARQGNIEKSNKLFKKSYQLNLKPPFYVMAESPNNTNTTFCTGYGGMLQTILYGFGGLHITEDGLIQKNPVLPKGWKSLVIKTANGSFSVNGSKN